MTTHLKTLICAALFIVVSGCSLAPEYTRPQLPLKDAWPQGEVYTAGEMKADEAKDTAIPWKTYFVNPELRGTLALAIENNRDLRTACLAMEKTMALYRIQRSEQLPTLNGVAQKSTQRIPESLSSTGESMIGRQYDLNVGITAYELDFFGRVKSLKEKALEQFLATEQARTSTQISLISRVAAAWITLAADKEKLSLAQEIYTSQKASYTMIQQRYDVGASSELDLRQAQTRVEAARIDIARYTGRVALDENALTLLLGCHMPENLLPKDLDIVDNDPRTLIQPVCGLPSSVLLNRPDILEAEFRLKAANADIGAARAAFFPRITLTGSLGAASGELNALFDDAPVWSFVPRITLPIFTGGRNKANLKATEVERDIAVATYEKTIQAAFREVADALAQGGTLEDQILAQKAFLDATAESYRLSDVRYKKGIDSYLSVLDAQRSLYAAEQAMIDTRLMKLLNRLALYKSMGGGATE